MNKLKQYWTHIVCFCFLIVFLISTIILYYAKVNPDFENESNANIMIALLITLFIFVILIWVAIIYTMIKIQNNKKIKNKTKYYLFTYLLNVFYIPCYHTEFELKDKFYKYKNLLYTIISVIIFGTSLILLYYSL